MLWAATCLCFFGCLRAGELMTSAGGQFDPRNHLGPRNVTVDGDTPLQWISVRIQRFKTDQFCKGATVTVTMGVVWSSVVPGAGLAEIRGQMGRGWMAP